MSVSGFILLDKPAGRTSFAALGEIKKKFPGRRVGHTGTLDSFATGLLIAVVGGYSRLAPWFLGLDKEYEAEIRFGRETDTLDPGGAVTRQGPVPARQSLEGVLPAFLGRIGQTPPVYSSIHVKGRRASDMARRGEMPELAAREVTISALELVSMRGDSAWVRVACSSGTYIRALARDIAEACGSCAHLGALRRTRVGPFSLSEAQTLSEAAAAPIVRQIDPEISAGLGMGLGRLRREAAETAFLNGSASAFADIEIAPEAAPQAKFRAQPGPERDIAVFSAAGALLGLVRSAQSGLAYRVVLSTEGEER